MKVRQIVEWLDGIAPFATAEAFDNVGLLMGDADSDVHTVLFAMDLTEDVADEAIECSAELIITHHPFIFHALKRIDYTGPRGRTFCKLFQNGISVIAAHTNWDQAAGGVSDSLAEALGLQSVTAADSYVRIGMLPAPLSATQFSEQIRKQLGVHARCYGNPKALISRVAVAGGAYGEGYQIAQADGAEAFVVGEIAHHEITDAFSQGLIVYDAGHFSTELPGVRALYNRFLADASQADWPVRAFLHDKAPYAGSFLAF